MGKMTMLDWLALLVGAVVIYFKLRDINMEARGNRQGEATISMPSL